MLYYDDHDYLDYNNIDELYDIDDYDSGEAYEDPTFVTSWEYNYHSLADELIDD